MLFRSVFRAGNPLLSEQLLHRGECVGYLHRPGGECDRRKGQSCSDFKISDISCDIEKNLRNLERYLMNSKELAWKIRRYSMDMVHVSRAAHIASVLSAADIIAVLYADILNVNPKNPYMPNRDRFIMSKGHAGAAIYAALAETGFFPVDYLKTYYTDGGTLSGHISHKGVPGVELSTGSLGHGVAVACGMALAARSAKQDYRIYTLVGDGECNEGVIWETALTANQYCLDNFTVIIDRNGMQAMGHCEELMQMESFADKWRSFGWEVVEDRKSVV